MRNHTKARAQSDEEVAAEELLGEDLLALPHETWEVLLRRELTTDLLDAAEHYFLVAAVSEDLFAHSAQAVRRTRWTPARFLVEASAFRRTSGPTDAIVT